MNLNLRQLHSTDEENNKLINIKFNVNMWYSDFLNILLTFIPYKNKGSVLRYIETRNVDWYHKRCIYSTLITNRHAILFTNAIKLIRTCRKVDII